MVNFSQNIGSLYSNEGECYPKQFPDRHIY